MQLAYARTQVFRYIGDFRGRVIVGAVAIMVKSHLLSFRTRNRIVLTRTRLQGPRGRESRIRKQELQQSLARS